MVITAEEVKIIDANSEELGVAVLQLMENAGAAAAKVVMDSFPKVENIIVCCGTGNNGGDGFVTARHLAGYGKKVTVILIGRKSRIHSSIARKNYHILEQMERSVTLQTLSDSSNVGFLEKEFKKADLIIDALLGIGLTSEPYEPIRSVIQMINASAAKVFSLDVPSGIFSDKPKKQKIMIQADKIATFHDTKPCLTTKAMKEKTVICGIGVPPEAEFFVGLGDCQATLPRRKATSHKGENGMVLIIGGSNEYSGAPILSARAALRTGADLVINCVPEAVAATAKSDSPNMIVRSFSGDYFTKKHVPEILEIFTEFDAMAIGPGLSTQKETFEFVQELLTKAPANKPIIIDADALKAIKNTMAEHSEKKIIVTPHAGEFAILFGESPPNKWFERLEFLEPFAKEYNVTILLKGKYDSISDGIYSKINRTGHEGMTVGGTGDVLTGIVAAISAINTNLFRAASVGSYIAGKAGELAAADFGNSLLATDVIEKIPEILLKIQK